MLRLGVAPLASSISPRRRSSPSQVSENPNDPQSKSAGFPNLFFCLHSSAIRGLCRRSVISKTLIFPLRNNTDPVRLFDRCSFDYHRASCLPLPFLPHHTSRLEVRHEIHFKSHLKFLPSTFCRYSTLLAYRSSRRTRPEPLRKTVISSNLIQPMEMAIAPDGKIF